MYVSHDAFLGTEGRASNPTRRLDSWCPQPGCRKKSTTRPRTVAVSWVSTMSQLLKLCRLRRWHESSDPSLRQANVLAFSRERRLRRDESWKTSQRGSPAATLC